MKHRIAIAADCALLVRLNHQLIADERHRNPMTTAELETRMRSWLAGGYQAVLFEDVDEVLGYALFREEESELHLQQFFIARGRRREGFGRRAMALLREQVWPRGKRVTVDALLTNEIALAFWRAVGFRDYYIGLELPPQ
jgi:ribosomal protein S18 acetylase RimI-like enzyme